MTSAEVVFLTNAVPKPFVRIIEQPLKSVRFRYYGERRPGTISGASSSPLIKTSFTIEIVGYEGIVKVVVSCVTHTPPYKPHPYNLFGPNCKDGFCMVKTEVTAKSPYISFPKLAIQCLKRNEMMRSLKIRKEKHKDSFLAFQDIEDVKTIDLNVVRLCVEVFLEKGVQSIAPIVSEPIYNKKTIPDPIIYKLSHSTSYVFGGEDIILLCPRISKDDITIRFFELKDGLEVWEDYGKFKSDNIYNNSAICFKPPRYYNQKITEPTEVFVQLVRPSDGTTSPPVSFVYLPIEAVLAPRSIHSKAEPISLLTFVQPANPSKEVESHLVDLSKSFTESQFILCNSHHDVITYNNTWLKPTTEFGVNY